MRTSARQRHFVRKVCRSLLAWRSRFPQVEILLVRGNHDRRAGDPPPGLGVEIVTAPHADPPFVLCHAPAECAEEFGLAGHLHPCLVLHGRGHQSLRLACFWLSRGCLVLPAFGSFTGSMEVMPVSGDRLFVIADDQVHETPAVRGIP
jgi:metallophosphoesterase superfamily enzyme